MRKTHFSGSLLTAGVSLYANLAGATPVDDLRAGTHVVVESVTGSIDDSPSESGGYEFTKAAGTLDFSVDRAAFGLGSGPPIPVTGTVLDSNTVQLSVNHVFSPVGEHGDIRVSKVVGSVLAKVVSLHGSVTPSCSVSSCAYSVRLDVKDGGKLTIDGSKWEGAYGVGAWIGFTKDAVNLNGLGLGGIPRPSLSSFDVTAPKDGCSGGFFSTRVYVGRVHLGSPATTDGAAVDVESSDASRLPAFRAIVKPGEDTISFPLSFSATDEGLFAIRASSGGASTTRYIDLHACMTMTLAFPRFSLGGSIWDVFCPPCVEHAYMTDRDFGVFRVSGEWFFSDPAGGLLPVSQLVGGPVSELALGPLGDLSGNIWSQQGEARSFRLTGWGYSPRLEFGPQGFSPFVSARGTAFAIAGGQNGSHVIAYGDGGQLEFPEPSNAYEIAGILASEELVVNAWSADGPRAYVATPNGASEIFGFGFGLRMVAVNASGAMLAAANDPQGGVQTLLFLPGPMPQPLMLPSLPGLPYSAPVGMSDDGIVLVNGYDGQGRIVPYLVAPGADPVPLAAQIDGTNGLELLEALSISPGARVVARALRDGEPAIVQLSPHFSL